MTRTYRDRPTIAMAESLKCDTCGEERFLDEADAAGWLELRRVFDYAVRIAQLLDATIGHYCSAACLKAGR